jgi:hypothetical protein
MKPKKKYLVKVYGGGNGRTLINTYEYDTMKEARASKANHDRYVRGYFNIVIDSVPLNEDEINSASAASQRRKGKYGNPEQE